MLISIVNTLTSQSVRHTNYIHLPMPPWHMRGVVTFKMLGSINVLIRRILMTDSESTVTYTKNSYFICKTKCETNRAY